MGAIDDCEQQEGPIVWALLSELGYTMSFDEACAVWRELSNETHSAHWLTDEWREHTKIALYRYITAKRKDAQKVLEQFPTPPRTWK